MTQTADEGTRPGYTVRRAAPEDLERVAAHIRRVTQEDLAYGDRPEWYWDVADLRGTYLDNPRHALFVAVDHADGALIGTTAVHSRGPKSPPHPQWLAERYAGPESAQLMRVYIARGHRRRGAARALVEAARRFVAGEGGYRTIYLHTDPLRYPDAERFWRAMPTREIYDARGRGEPSQALHFELDLPAQ